MSEFILDDRDPSVDYIGLWSNEGNSGANEGTLKLTRRLGAQAVVRFEGTAITVLGHLSARGTGSPPASTYYLDGAEVGKYSGGQHGSEARNAEFFSSATLEPGPHTLIAVNDVAESYFWLDGFRITPNPAPEPEPAPDAPAESSGGGNGSAGGSSGGDSSAGVSISAGGLSSSAGGDDLPASRSQTGAAAGQVSVYVTMGGGSSAAPETSGSAGSSVTGGEDSKPPVGAIVGGILGGLCILLIFVGFLFWLKRRKSDQAWHTRPAMGEGAYSDGPSGTALVTPFNVASMANSSSPNTAQYSFNSHGSGNVSEKSRLGHPSAATGATFDSRGTGPSQYTPRALFVPQYGAGERSVYAPSQNGGASMYASSPEPSAHPQRHQPQHSITSSEALSDRPPARSGETVGAYAGAGTLHSIPSEAPPAYFRRSEVQPLA